LSTVAEHLTGHVTRVSRCDLRERVDARRRRYEEAVESPRALPVPHLAQPRGRGAYTVVPDPARAFEHLAVVASARTREEPDFPVNVILEDAARILQFGAQIGFAQIAQETVGVRVRLDRHPRALHLAELLRGHVARAPDKSGDDEERRLEP